MGFVRRCLRRWIASRQANHQRELRRNNNITLYVVIVDEEYITHNLSLGVKLYRLLTLNRKTTLIISE